MSARARGPLNSRRAAKSAGSIAGIPKRASNTGWRGTWSAGRIVSENRSSQLAASGATSRRYAPASSPRPRAVSSTDRRRVAAEPSSSGRATGLATAFFRFYLLDTLSTGPGRPASILARASAEKLPFATGAFARALQSLLEGGHLTPAPEGTVALTALGAAERMQERERWTAVMPAGMRILGDIAPRPAPVIAEPAPL